MGISLIFGRALSAKAVDGAAESRAWRKTIRYIVMQKRPYSLAICLRFLLPRLWERLGKALINCQFNSYSICIRLQFFVYLHRGKSQEAFSFFVVWGRKGDDLAGTGFQHGRYNTSICVILQCKVADIAWQDEWFWLVMGLILGADLTGVKFSTCPFCKIF